MSPNNSKKPSFLVFSDDWGEHPSSCQHIFKHIVKDHKVLWVNTIGMRNMKLTGNDFKKALLKIRKMLFGVNKISQKEQKAIPNLHVIQPLMLPFIANPTVRRLNAQSVISAVKKKMKEIGLKNPIFVATVPNACDYAGNFREKKVVYYCVDDFSEWPGLDHELVEEMENKLVKRCDIFFATSSKLYNVLKKTGKPTTLLTHGVDAKHFSNLPEQEHSLLKNIPKPRVGYFGLFDERSDQDLLITVAEKLPEVSFVITGNVATNISKLEKTQNIYFTGPVHYTLLPDIVSGWSACMLPYKLNELSQSMNPLKLKEYMATGKQVIATPLPAAKDLSRYVKVAEASDWSVLLEGILQNKGELSFEKQEESRIFIKNEDWSVKARLFLGKTYIQS